jgi:predicted HAD superfamily Cof-like phosphohydrolase
MLDRPTIYLCERCGKVLVREALHETPAGFGHLIRGSVNDECGPVSLGPTTLEEMARAACDFFDKRGYVSIDIMDVLSDFIVRERAQRDARASWPRAQDLVREFHLAFGLPIGTTPSLTATTTDQLRLDLVDEEVEELHRAIEDGDLVAVADALADIVYVAFGAADTWGFDLGAVILEVHRSNMTKLGEDGRPELRSDGKVLKGPHYEPPNIPAVLRPFATLAAAPGEAAPHDEPGGLCDRCGKPYSEGHRTRDRLGQPLIIKHAFVPAAPRAHEENTRA